MANNWNWCEHEEWSQLAWSTGRVEASHRDDADAWWCRGPVAWSTGRSSVYVSPRAIPKQQAHTWNSSKHNLSKGRSNAKVNNGHNAKVHRSQLHRISGKAIAKKCKIHRNTSSKGLKVLVSGRGCDEMVFVELVEKHAEIFCSKECKLFLKDCTSQSTRKHNRFVVEVISEYDPKMKETFSLEPGKTGSRQCPGCKQRSIFLQIPKLEPEASRPIFTSTASRHARTAGKREPKHAFSAALWAPEGDKIEELNKYIVDAIHVGYQLKTLVPNIDIDRVLLVDDGAKRGHGFSLLQLLWQVRCVEEVQVDASLLGTCQRRFTKVFTKLRHWDLDDYNQIAALDLDLLIRRSDVKDLFGYRAPAAFFRGNRDTIPGDQRAAETLYNKKTGRLRILLPAKNITEMLCPLSYQDTLEKLSDQTI